MPKEPIPAIYEGLPVVTSEVMRNLDRLASEKYAIPAAQLMETAGRMAAEEIASTLTLPSPSAGEGIVVCCGKGSNGGDGLVTARYLKQKGFPVSVFICPAREDKPYPALVLQNLEKVRAAGVPVFEADGDSLAKSLSSAFVVIDAILGTGSKGRPQGIIRDMIQAIARAKKPVYALDIPSGIDPDTGYHSGAFISAEETLTFGLPKTGLLAKHAQRYVGRLKVLDIGYPPELVKELSKQ